MGDRGPIAVKLRGKLLLAELGFSHQLAVAARLLYRIEVRAMEVLDQGALERSGLVGFDDHDGNLVQPRALGRTQAPLAGHQLVAPLGGPHQDRLQDADLSDGRGEVFQLGLVERPARLSAVRPYRVHPNAPQRISFLELTVPASRQQRIQSPPEARSSRHLPRHLPSPWFPARPPLV